MPWKVVLVGSDCPGLSPGYIRQAFHVRQTHDLVLGPVEDGGYALIGLKQVERRLFADVLWSTDQELLQTLERAAELGWSVQLLDELWDLDYSQDLQRLKKEYPAIA